MINNHKEKTKNNPERKPLIMHTKWNYFKYQNSSHLYESLNSTKNTKRNKIQVDLVKNALTDLKIEIKNNTWSNA